MASIHFNCDENFIDVLKSKLPKDFREVDFGDGVSKLFNGDSFVGVRLSNALAPSEKIGRWAEVKFFEYLERQEFCAHYIDQGLDFKSEVLQKTYEAKRPDIMVYIPDVGFQLYDVKARKRLSLAKPNTNCFWLSKSDMEKTIHLDKNFHVPVWFVFCDRACFDKGQNIEFFKIPVSLLKRYLAALKTELGEQELERLEHLRIPLQLMDRFEESQPFNPLAKRIEAGNLKSWAVIYKDYIRNIKKAILEKLTTTPELKSHFVESFPKWCEQNNLTYVMLNEVENFVEILFEEKKLEYENGKPLRVI